jgi:outer membrane protein LpxR
MRRPIFRALILTATMGACGGLSPGLAAGDREAKSPWDLKMFRFEFDNDSFIGSDDAFSAGWSFQVHSRVMDRWNPAYAGWIGKLPGLGDDGPGRRVVRWAFALSQIIITPKDISIAAPQPNDAPWAGSLGVTGTWSSYDNRRLGAMQIYLGCMGPCSQAEDVQRFIHEDLGFGDPPKGWKNQLSNKALANLNYEYRYKLFSPAVSAYLPRRFAADLAVGSEAAAGNLTTRVNGEVELRFGWGLPMGFTKIPDPPGVGMVLDPVYLDPEQPLTDLYGWRIYFNLVARRHWITYLAPSEGGPTESGANQPVLRPYPGQKEVLFGVHLTRVPFSVHVKYYRYFASATPGISGNLDWVNFSFEYRF